MFLMECLLYAGKIHGTINKFKCIIIPVEYGINGCKCSRATVMHNQWQSPKGVPFVLFSFFVSLKNS